jgi:hypothetical protein
MTSVKYISVIVTPAMFAG